MFIVHVLFLMFLAVLIVHVNCHDITALMLQRICDNKKWFLDAFTGPPCKIHNANVFKLLGFPSLYDLREILKIVLNHKILQQKINRIIYIYDLI